MISIDKIKNVKKLVTHKHCADGTSSALIIKDVLPDIEVFFAAYHDEEYLNLQAEEGLLFCDISPPTGREDEFLEAKSIVLDHHIKTQSVVEKFQNEGLGVYGDIDDGVAGATLAYRHIWKPFEGSAKNARPDVCTLARLAAIRDTWQTNDLSWEQACVQSEALFFFGPEYLLNKDRDIILSKDEINTGKIIFDNKRERTIRAVKNAFIFNCNDNKVAIVSGLGNISDISEELRSIGVSLSLGFSYIMKDGQLYMITSARSDGSFDCNKFVSKYSGGGHTRAAGGLTTSVTPESQNPFESLKTILKQNGNDCWIK